ncbi:HlyD family efflux transporter periplasmic adaptor subunit [Microcoleus sp. MON1_C1]|uniref:HlyD family efflux transporter periplasmic adaptor subunit n=1 Tax=Microcoleus sp. MON1_C1 TaxID=2818827 RepID=UPI002FCF7A42
MTKQISDRSIPPPNSKLKTPNYSPLPLAAMSLTPEAPPAETFDNDQFLPPVSRWTTLGGILMVATFGGAIALASVTKYSATVKADAIVRPAGEVRVVQAATEGTVESIAVSENQTVKEGDAIAVVDASRLGAQQQQLQEIINQSQTAAQQISQQLRDLENQILASAQFKSIQSETSAQQELIESALIKFATSLPDVAERLGRSRRVLLVKRSSLQQQLIQAKKQLNQIDLKLENSVIRAPADGTILRLEVRNTGQTVQAGSAIAKIVPSDVPLVVKAKVTSQDIARIQIGQPVQIRISALPFPDYGTLKGTVSEIAPDAIATQNPTNNLGTAYYEVAIKPEQTYLTKLKSANSPFFGNSQANVPRQYSIQSGMEGRADIITGEETVLTFVLRKARLLTDW